MNILKYLVIHCTATPECREVTRADIEKWHLKDNGWSRVGYTDMIHLDGRLENLIPFDQDNEVDPWEISNGARGFNSISRHIVYVGGSAAKKAEWMKNYPPKDTRTPEQLRTLETYVKYMLIRHPQIRVVGHNELSNKSCPSFDVPAWLKSIGIHENNIGILVTA